MNLLFILIFTFLSVNCFSQDSPLNDKKYRLTKVDRENAVVIIFPCFLCDAEHTKREANFLKELESSKISVILLNENQKLFLENEDKNRILNLIETIFKENTLSTSKIFIGGFSSGGNLSIIMAQHLITHSNIKPKGIFVVDAPIDLEQLYYNSKKDIERNFNETSVAESKYIINLLENHIGNPSINKANYIKYSPFLLSEKEQTYLKDLKNLKIRFYSEPDMEWYKINRGKEYKDLNAYQLEKAHKYLNNSELIFTKNKGFRAEGQRHPHSWSIINGQDLIKWLLNH